MANFSLNLYIAQPVCSPLIINNRALKYLFSVPCSCCDPPLAINFGQDLHHYVRPEASPALPATRQSPSKATAEHSGQSSTQGRKALACRIGSRLADPRRESMNGFFHKTVVNTAPAYQIRASVFPGEGRVHARHYLEIEPS